MYTEEKKEEVLKIIATSKNVKTRIDILRKAGFYVKNVPISKSKVGSISKLQKEWRLLIASPTGSWACKYGYAVIFDPQEIRCFCGKDFVEAFDPCCSLDCWNMKFC